jgi:hypothetical protein
MSLASEGLNDASHMQKTEGEETCSNIGQGISRPEKLSLNESS